MKSTNVLLLSIILISSFACEKSHSKEKKQPLTQLEKSFLRGRFNPAKNSDFVKIPVKYALRSGMYLQKRTLAQFIKMADAAAKEKISLYILSGTRNFYSQRRIWEVRFQGRRKVGGLNLKKAFLNEEERARYILRWSSMPGTSRHHWGTDFDIVFSRKNPRLANEIYEHGQGLKTFTWLRKNALKFGFCLPYLGPPDKRNPGKYTLGYNQERWHWSYKPLAKKYLKQYIAHANELMPDHYDGDRAGRKLYMNYVSNVSKECQ